MPAFSHSLSLLVEVSLAAGCITALLTRAAKRAAFKFGISATRPRDDISQKIPVLGGPPIVAGAFAALAAAGGAPAWLVLPIVLLCAAGIIDDAAVLSPRQKIAAEAAAASLLVALMPRVSLTGYSLIDSALAVCWLVTTANAFNLIDGLDGLAGGVGLIIAAVIGCAASLHHLDSLALESFALAGALAGFLAYNLSPASIFMGDSGALPIGLLLGFLALQAGCGAVSEPLVRFLFPLVVMLVPLMDTTIVTISRLATGNSISRHGLDHSHHRLLGLGLSVRWTVAACWGVSALSGICALAISTLTGIYVVALVLLVVLSGGVIGLFMVDLTFESVSPALTYRDTRGLARLILRSAYEWRLGDVLLDAATISAAYFGAYLIRLDFNIPPLMALAMIHHWWQVLGISYVALFSAGVYRGIWRYTEVADAMHFMTAAIVAGAGFGLLQSLWGAESWSITLLFTMLLFNFLAGTRLSFKVLRIGVSRLARINRRVLIFGAGSTGHRALDFLMASRDGLINQVIGFLDDDPFKHGKRIQGHPVLGPFEIVDQIYESAAFDEILVAIGDLPRSRQIMVRAFATRRRISLHNFLVGEVAGMDRAEVFPEPQRAAV